MSREVISQPRRRSSGTSKDSNARSEELVQRLALLGDYRRLQLATALSKAFEDLARRDPDEIFKRSHEVFELAQAADIVHGWSREKPDVWC